MDTATSKDLREALSLAVAARQTPELLLWAGVLTFAFGVVNLVTIPDEPVASWAVNVLIGPPPIDPDLSLSFAGPPTLLLDPPPVLHWWEHAGRPVWRSRGT